MTHDAAFIKRRGLRWIGAKAKELSHRLMHDYHYSVYSNPEKGPDVGQVITIPIKLCNVLQRP